MIYVIVIVSLLLEVLFYKFTKNQRVSIHKKNISTHIHYWATQYLCKHCMLKSLGETLKEDLQCVYYQENEYIGKIKCGETYWNNLHGSFILLSRKRTT